MTGPGQDLLLNRAMLSVQETPYVGRFARGWHRLATTDPPAAPPYSTVAVQYAHAVHLAAQILSVFFIVVCLLSALTDYRHHPEIVATMDRFGLPSGFEVIAGVTKNLAAFGLILGFATGSGYGTLTAVTATCLAAYFFVALIFHARAHDSGPQLAPAAVLFLLATLFAVVSW